MKSILSLALIITILSIECAPPRKGYDYKSHHKRSAKAWKKKAPQNLTKYDCRKQR